MDDECSSEVRFEAFSTYNSFEEVIYKWKFGYDDSSNLAIIDYQYQEGWEYKINIDGSTFSGCTDQINMRL